jgi:hypothetical protein
MLMRTHRLKYIVVGTLFCSTIAFAQEETKLLASNGAAYDWFGYSVSVDGHTAMIGAEKGLVNIAGSAYVFTRDFAGSWSEAAELIPTDFSTSFGSSVSVDGDVILIGSYTTDATYVFTRDGTQQAKLTASDPGTNDYFGWAVSVDGSIAVIGAFLKDSNAGAAYVFSRNYWGNWSEVEKLTASDWAPGDSFGYAVSVGGDTAVIGAPFKDSGAGTGSGAAYVFTRNQSGSWVEVAKLTASDAAALDSFGYSVSVDGNTAVVGADDKDGAGEGSGAAYVFIRNKFGYWNEVAKLTASDAAASDSYGSSVSVEGSTIVIGAPYHNRGMLVPNAGAAYVYRGDYWGNWSEVAKLTASDWAANDFFGAAVSVDDGGSILIGAWTNDDAGTESGSAYVFTNECVCAW